MRVWPSGWVCHAVRALGSNVTLAPATRAGSEGGAWNRGSTRTVPVNHSAGPMPQGCGPPGFVSQGPNGTGPDAAWVAGIMDKGLEDFFQKGRGERGVLS